LVEGVTVGCAVRGMAVGFIVGIDVVGTFVVGRGVGVDLGFIVGVTVTVRAIIGGAVIVNKLFC